DNALVHCSLPNHTDRPRVVAAIGMRPSERPLVHYLRHDEARAGRYDVDEDFFLTTTPQALLTAPPRQDPDRLVPTNERPIDGPTLLARLDSSPLTWVDRGRKVLAQI